MPNSQVSRYAWTNLWLAHHVFVTAVGDVSLAYEGLEFEPNFTA